MKANCVMCGVDVPHADPEKFVTCPVCVNKLMICPQEKLIELREKCNKKENHVKERALASFIEELPDSGPLSPYGREKQVRFTGVQMGRRTPFNTIPHTRKKEG